MPGGLASRSLIFVTTSSIGRVRKERTMEARLNAQQASPAAYTAMIGLEMFVRKASKLEPSLVELVKVRASQINGCAKAAATLRG